MTGPREPEMFRGKPVDPRAIKILLRYREAVAQATERAYRDLERIGAWTPPER